MPDIAVIYASHYGFTEAYARWLAEELEAELLEAINRFGTGPAGFGGATTALAVHVEQMATHIACLPVAVNINCHVARHESVVL